MNYQHPTGKSPKHVDVVALGRSCVEWVKHGLTKGRPVGDSSDEVWTVNRGIRCFRSDLAFVLDDLTNEFLVDPAYGEALARYPNPIITTTVSARVPNPIRYPSVEVMKMVRQSAGVSTADPYWHNSVPMLLAYAWFIGVEQITLWGCDYTLDDGQVIESDRANCEYWVGWCRAHGMRVGVPVTSTLMNAAKYPTLHVYGLLDQGSAGKWLEGE